MKYVLRKIIRSETDYYVYADRLIRHKLKQAKVFKTISEIDNFKQNRHWSSTYETIAVTEKDLFKARLSNS